MCEVTELSERASEREQPNNPIGKAGRQAGRQREKQHTNTNGTRRECYGIRLASYILYIVLV
eukprot:COSAG05_NODE_983_length_6299_cov_14.948387_3_plen_62_part_00